MITAYNRTTRALLHSIAFAVFTLALASCNFFGDPEQFRPDFVITASPAGGVVTNGTQVTLSTTTEGVAIYYTINETEPSPANGTLYSADSQPVITPDNFILRAIAVKDGLKNSVPIEITYTIEGHASRPTATPAGGVVDYGTEIDLKCATDGALIYYAFGGEEPSELSPTSYKYDPSQKLRIDDNKTVLKAIATHINMDTSGILTVNYTLPVPTPKIIYKLTDDFVLPEGTAPYNKPLELQCAINGDPLEGVIIYYTLDGSDPGFFGTRYFDTAKPILKAGQTLRAIARKKGMTNSAEFTATPIVVNTSDIVTWLNEVSMTTGALDNPAYLPIAMNLKATASNGTPVGSWERLVNALESADKYVKLDLSRCTIDGNSFGHDNIDLDQNNRIPGMLKIIDIILPKNATAIHDRTFFKAANLVDITFPNGITSIGVYTFQGCTSLALTSLPDGLTSINMRAFMGCTNIALTSLPDSLTSIGGNTFDGCISLTRISLPKEITYIGEYAFYGCTSLSEVTIKAVTPPELGTDVFGAADQTLQIKVPYNSVNAYKTASGWKDYAGRIVAIQ